MADPYEVLGVARDANAIDIHHAYRRKALHAHPDTGGDTGGFRRLNEAHALLLDPRRRAHYDATGEELPAVIDNDFAESVGVLGAAFDAVLMACGQRNEDATKIDMVARLRARIEADRAARNEERRKVKASRSAFSALKNRFSAKKGPNFLDNFVQQKLDMLGQHEANLDRADRAAERALLLLDDFSYRFDVQTTIMQYGGLWDTTTSSTLG